MTLSPEKEVEALETIKQVVAQRLKGAERDVRRGVADSLPDALAYATAPGLLVKHLQALLAALSTERQAREAAEKEVERLSKQIEGGKRELVEWGLQCARAENARDDAEAKLAAQAPQDVAGLVEGLILEAVNLALAGVKAPGRAQASDVEYYVDRILAALRPSPISHESKGLELAAADNNREALVEVPKEPTDAMVREGSDVFANRFGLKDDILVLPMTVQGVYRAMIAAFQCRQEGK